MAKKKPEEKEVRYVYAMRRAGHGYKPGDAVPRKFAETHPWAVKEGQPNGSPTAAQEQPNDGQQEPDMLGPGDEVKVSGQYQVVNADGQPAEGESEYTLVEGEPAPPTPKSGLRFMLTDASKHQGGER